MDLICAHNDNSIWKMKKIIPIKNVSKFLKIYEITI